jgi:hypothetical protein
LPGAYLHEIAKLVGHPKPATRRAGPDRPPASSQRLLEATLVTNIADDRLTVFPDIQLAMASAVLQAVGDHFMDREGEVTRDRFAQAELARTYPYEPSRRGDAAGIYP